MYRQPLLSRFMGVRGSVRFFSTSCVWRREVDPEEREREVNLRNQVMQKFKGMPIPEITHHEYGHFATSGINYQAAGQAFGDAQNSAGSAWQSGKFTAAAPNATGKVGVDWVMLLTGCLLVFVSGQMLYQQMGRDVDDLEIPLWVASIDTQAKHLILSVQFDQATRDGLKKEFQTVRLNNPLADFFEWVRTQRPEFGFGNRYGMDYAMGTVTSILSSTNSRELVAFAQALQGAMNRRDGSPQQRLDDFLQKLQTVGGLYTGAPAAMGMASPMIQPPPFVPQVSATATAAPSHEATQDAGAHGSVPFK